MFSFEFTNFILYCSFYIGIYYILYRLFFFVTRPSALHKVLAAIIAMAKLRPTVFTCLC